MASLGRPLYALFYGPYAENLRHVLSEVEGHLTSGYSGEGDAPTEQLELLPSAVDKAEAS